MQIIQKYLIIVVIGVCICTGCKSNRKNDAHIFVEQVFDEHEAILQDRIFKSEKLQDTLILFLSSIDSIPNPFGAPTMYMVFFDRIKSDTIVKFTAYPGLIKTINIDTGLEWDMKEYIIGGCKIASKAVIVYYNGITDFSNIICKDVLSMKFVEDNDFFRTYEGIDHGWKYSPISERRYKLINNDSLQLLYKQKGLHEKNKK